MRQTWSDIRAKIYGFITWTKGQPVLNAGAKVALESIPVVGPVLSSIYDGIGEGDKDEGTELILEVLARVDALGPELIGEVKAEIEGAAGSGVNKLRAVAGTLDEIRAEISTVRQQSARMAELVERIDREITSLSWGGTDFCADSPFDRVAFFVHLHAFLTDSKELIEIQSELARQVVGTLPDVVAKAAKSKFSGYDDRILWAMREGHITRPTTYLVQELRSTTDQMREANLRVRGLVRAHGGLLPDDSPVKALDAHLSAWLAKYAYLDEKDGENMVLIFVGVDPTNAKFPHGIDALVEQELGKALATAKLDHVKV